MQHTSRPLKRYDLDSVFDLFHRQLRMGRSAVRGKSERKRTRISNLASRNSNQSDRDRDRVKIGRENGSYYSDSSAQ